FGERAKAVIARSISPASRTLTGLTSTPKDGATDWITPNWPVPADMAGSRRSAARAPPRGGCFRDRPPFPPNLSLYIKKNEALAPPPRRRQPPPAPAGS